MLRFDIGSRRIYTYHVLGGVKNIGINMKIVEEWFPKTAKAMEIYILSDLLNRLGGEDSRWKRFETQEFPLIFMTDKFIRKEDAHRKVFYVDNKNALNEAIIRADDFCNRGLIKRQGNSLTVTFSGKRALEDLIAFSEDAQSEVSKSIDAMVDLLAAQHKALMESQAHLSLKLDEIVRIKNAIENNQSAKISDVLSVTNDACSLIAHFTTAAPYLFGLLKGVIGVISSI